MKRTKPATRTRKQRRQKWRITEAMRVEIEKARIWNLAHPHPPLPQKPPIEKKSPYAPEAQNSQLFWQEVWKQKESLRQLLRDSS